MKNDYAGEDQQQITRHDLTTSSQVRVVNQKNIVMGSDGARNEE
jgi:hypothetical protein